MNERERFNTSLLTQESPDELPGIVREAAANGFNRRDFLKGTGVLIVSFSLAGAEKLLDMAETADAQVLATKVDSFVAIAADGSVTGFTGKVDLGTGTSIGLRQMLAEEVEVAYERITWIQGDTALTPPQGATVGSQSIASAGPTIRRAGAAARQFLVNLAAERLNVPASQLDVNDGVVFVRADPSKKMTYGELIGGARFNLDVPAAGQIQLKTADQFKVIGKPIPRHDIVDRILGTPFIQSVRVPGMVHGRVVRPPVDHATLISVDETSVSSLPGFIKVVVEGNFVGVVTEREEQAIRAAELLKTQWTTPEPALPDQANLYAFMRSINVDPGNIVNPVGDVEAAMAAAARVYDRTYEWPFQMHGSLTGPAAVADVGNGEATIWSGTQDAHGMRNPVSRYLGIPVEKVHIIWKETAGVYGRASIDDATLDAVVLSKAVGRPVRVQWMRGDEHRWEPKGPAHSMSVRAGVDEKGAITAWMFEDRTMRWNVSEPLAQRLINPIVADRTSNNGSGCAGQDYAFPARQITRRNLTWENKQDTGLRVNPLRAPGDPARAFASESLLDELASAARADPVEFRLQHLNSADADQKRVIDVIKATADRFGWQARYSPKPGVGGTGVATGRGFAFARRRTFVAAAVEVDVDQSTGEVLVKRIVIAHDSGLMINPDSITQQVEGQVIQTVGRALMEEVMFDRYKVISTDWVTYPIIKTTQFPAVEVVLINRPELNAGTGVGEPALNPVPAAIGNAIFDATGARLRRVPFTPERVKAALDAR